LMLMGFHRYVCCIWFYCFEVWHMGIQNSAAATVSTRTLKDTKKPDTWEDEETCREATHCQQ